MKIWNFYTFFFSSCFNAYMPFIGLFLLTYRGFSNAEIIRFFALYALAKAILEIPTGVFADRISEKHALLIGSMIRCISVVMLFYGSFWVVFMSQVALAMGDAFNSGCEQALLYHYYKENEASLASRGLSYNNFISNVASISWSAVASAALFGYFLAKIDVIYPFIITGILFAISFITTLTLPTSRHHRETVSYDILKKAILEISNVSQVRFWFLFGTSVSSFIICIYLLLQPFLNENNIASANNGLLYFFVTLFAVLGSYVNKRFSTIQKSNFIPLITTLFLCVISVTLWLENSFVIVLLMLCILRFVWGAFGPYFIYNINTSVKKDSIRSTMLSLSSLLCGIFTSLILYVFSLTPLLVSKQYLVMAFIVFVSSSYFLVKKKLMDKSCLKESK